ncbi:hypothetical protein G6F56_007043 [Rhizopus delemar]|nr:hypothetical protein G6F56_007043 [Rhizopus delemar]
MPSRHEESEPLLNGSSFDITVDDISQLFDPKSDEQLHKLGGVDTICKKLQVDPSLGLSSDQSSNQDSFKERQAYFGKNILPEPKTKSFLQLLWAAYNDKTLIMLR